MPCKPFLRVVFLAALYGLCAFGQPPDSSIDRIEFIQVAQDRDNSVPLVAGKTTVARVVIRGAGTSGISGSLTADGFPETLRPFGNPLNALDFLMPLHWTRLAGPLQVRAAVKPNGGSEMFLTGSATFQSPPNWPTVFRVFHLQVCASDVNGQRRCVADSGDVSDAMQRAYPLPDGGVEYNPVPAGLIDWPGHLGSAAEQIRFARFLTAYYYLLEQPAPVDQLFAWIPSGGGAQSLGSGGLGHISWDTLDADRAANAATLARGIAYNLGLLDTDFTAPATLQALFNANAIAPSVAAPAEYLIIGGALAQLDPGYRVISSRPGAPANPAGTHCLRFTGGASADYCFTPFADAFEVKAPLPAGTTRVALISRDPAGGETELTSLTAGAAPSIDIVAPRTGDAWQGKRTMEWTGSDPDGKPLVYALQYSPDNGASWTPLAIDLKETRYEVDGARIQGGSQVLFRVLASSGLTTAAAVAGPVTVMQSPRLTLDQASLDFLNGTVGRATERTVLLSNTGSGPLTVAGQISTGPYTLISGGGNLVIPADGQRSITVRWAPTATGPQPGTLSFTSGDPSLPGADVSLRGVAFDDPVPAIRLAVSSINFDSVNAGQSKDLRLTLGNGGAVPLTVSSVSSSNARFTVSAPSLPITIQAGQSADVTVRFSPNASGGVSGTLSVASNDPARSTVTVALTGIGAAGPAPSIAVTPASFDFGAIATGQIKDAKLSIGNSGTADLIVRSISSSSAAFTLVDVAVPITVVPGRSADITVRFAPSTTGAASASLTVASSDPARPNATIPLTGSGIATVVSSVLRTIAYHEITTLPFPLDIYNLPAISRNGNRAVFTVRTTELWAINTDGTGLLKVDTNATPGAHFVGISDDGAKALVWGSTFLRVVNADGSGGSTVLTSNGSVQAARLSGDGRTIAFVNSTGAGTLTVNGNTRIAQRGIWTINTDGTNLRAIAGGTDAASLLGVADVNRMVADSAFPSGIDISVNGARIVFGVEIAGRGRAVLAVNGDGSVLRVIRSGLPQLLATSISGDGSTVAYTSNTELGVARFDGSGGLTMPAPPGHVNLQVSNDGSLVFAGGRGNGLLWRADGTRLVALFAPLSGSALQLAYENGVNRATMNGDGTRFLFTAPSLQNGIVELGIAEMNPVSLGAAPAIVNPTVDPASVSGDGVGGRAIITARVTSPTPVVVSAQSFLQGLPDIGTAMTDTGGGGWGGALFYSNSASGPRVLRVKAETQSADGKRHATAIDFGGLAVR